jgi:hypothetical protein
MIEWRWELEPLTVRDETATNLAEILNFAAPNPDAKAIEAAATPLALCPPGGELPSHEWLPLMEMAARFGWFPI